MFADILRRAIIPTVPAMPDSQPLTAAALTIYTIGHSNRSEDEFLELLTEHGVRRVLDIRTIPKSLANPQFGGEALRAFLERNGIGYSLIPRLGGLRKVRPDSPNGAWRNKSFQGYADYMQTEDFREGLEEAISLARKEPCALMCAEAVPWRCHRSLVADAMLVRGIRVKDIMGSGPARPRKLTPWAHVDGLRVTYPPSGTAIC